MFGNNYIDGGWRSAARSFDSVNPANGQILGSAAYSTASDVSDAVAAAQKACPLWSSTPIIKRAEVLAKVAQCLRREIESAHGIHNLICQEMGKRPIEASIEVAESADILEFFSSQGIGCLGEKHISLSNAWPTKKSIVRFEPVGVVGVIKPWNYPLELPIWSIGASLICGNTVVFKPSEITPLVGVRLTEFFEEAGLPRGVLNLITGDGTAGIALTQDRRVDMISFTGRTAVGRQVAVSCAMRLQRANLELAGKDAMIVLEDADVDLAVNGAVWGAFSNCGQTCVGVRRLLVQNSIKDYFMEKLVTLAGSLKIGTDIGPLASEEQRRRVKRHITDAIEHGAKLLCGGSIPQDLSFAQGFYFEPTILERTQSNMLVELEDTFGPVLCVNYFSTPEQAISLNNSVPFDLGASVWTRDSRCGAQIAEKLNTGIVWVNDVNVAFPQTPWAGRRWSGSGLELSEFALYEYSVKKHISFETGDDTSRPWWFPYQC